MSKTIITTKDAPAPIGPYNQAVRAGNMLYTSGQIPLDKETGEIVGKNVAIQTKQVIVYLQAIMQEAGGDLKSIVKTTVFLKNMSDFPEMNKIYAEFFPEKSAPARSTIEVARLPKDVLVEIEAVAILD